MKIAKLLKETLKEIKNAGPTKVCVDYWDDNFDYVWEGLCPGSKAISSQKRQEFERHLWNCPFCFREYRILKDKLERAEVKKMEKVKKDSQKGWQAAVFCAESQMRLNKLIQENFPEDNCLFRAFKKNYLEHLKKVKNLHAEKYLAQARREVNKADFFKKAVDRTTAGKVRDLVETALVNREIETELIPLEKCLKVIEGLAPEPLKALDEIMAAVCNEFEEHIRRYFEFGRRNMIEFR